MGIIWFIIGFIGAIWAAMDATDRGKSGCLVFVLILLLGPIGILLWLVFRPEEQ
jgi:hypothetical protein